MRRSFTPDSSGLDVAGRTGSTVAGWLWLAADGRGPGALGFHLSPETVPEAAKGLATLGAVEALPPEAIDAFEKMLEEIYSKAKMPEEVAELVFAAIVEGRFWIQTDGFFRDAIAARHRSIENDTDPPARGNVLSVYND